MRPYKTISLVARYVLLKTTGLILSAGLLSANNTTQAQSSFTNILTNPGAENSLYGWRFNSSDIVTSNPGWNVQHTGDHSFYFSFSSSGLQVPTLYQINPVTPNQRFTADGWIGPRSFIGNFAYIQVSFLDGFSNTLALYSSTTVHAGATSSWQDLVITNQLNPNTGVATNTVTTMVAPAGAVQVKFAVICQGGWGDWISWDDMSLLLATSTTNAFEVTFTFNEGQPVTSFPTENGFTYTLVYKNNLAASNWTMLGSIAGDGTVKTLADTTATGVTQRFYAVQAQSF